MNCLPLNFCLKIFKKYLRTQNYILEGIAKIGLFTLCHTYVDVDPREANECCKQFVEENKMLTERLKCISPLY